MMRIQVMVIVIRKEMMLRVRHLVRKKTITGWVRGRILMVRGSRYLHYVRLMCAIRRIPSRLLVMCDVT